jgi:putative ABC transport system permease protein
VKSRRFISAVAWLVPADMRREWQRDWESELTWSAAHDRGRWHQWRRARGAVQHATWLRAQRWRTDMFLHDLRDGLRALITRPALTAVAVLTLALGIGANTAIFSVVNAVLLRELPYPQADQLVSIYATNREFGFERGVERPEDIQYWIDHSETAALIAPLGGGSATVTQGGEPERIRVSDATPEFFQVMNVAPAIGRVFTADDVTAGAHVVVVSDELWRSRLGRATDLTDVTIDLNGERWLVIGVMPPAFKYPVNIGMWRPFDFSKAMKAWYLGSVARLKPGVTVEAAQRDFDRLAAELASASPKARQGRGFKVVGTRQDLAYRSIDGLKLMQGVVLLVLLIACANVANLLLAQASLRQREFSVRAAIGASRPRLFRQLLTESLVLSTLGAALGAAIAVPGVRALVSAAPPLLLPYPDTIGVNWTALAFTAAVAVTTSVIFGLAPALMLSSPNLTRAMGQGSRTASSGLSFSRRQYFRGGLVAAETALALVLLIGGGLLIRSFTLLTAQAPGFRTDHFLTAQVSLPAANYPTDEQRHQFWSTLIERVGALPGVSGAVVSNALPFSNWEWQTDFRIEGREDVANNGVGIREVSPDYFATLGIPLLRGRTVTAADVAGAEPVAFVSDAFVARDMKDIEPIGHHVRLGPKEPWLTIAGVVGSTRHIGFDEHVRPEIYVPARQQSAEASMLIGLRTTAPPESLAQPVRDAVKALDPRLPVQSVKTMDQLMSANVAERRFLMTLLTLFAGLAALLAAFGVYSVMSFLVSQGRREIGIRLALGARPLHVQRRLVGQGLRVVSVGIATGLIGALWLTKLLKSQLFETTPNDPVTIVLMTALLLAAAVLACWLPARRTSRVDPTDALRET